MKVWEKTRYVFWGILLGAVFCPAVSFAQVPAALQVYTTHGDFDVVAKAFQTIALITSDVSYKALFFSIVALISLGLVAANVGRAAFGGKMEAISWARVGASIVTGAILFTAFVANTSDMVVYDEYLNRQVTVTDVPDGIVFLANFSNLIENGIQDIVDTTDIDGFSYRENPSAIVISTLKEIFETRPSLAGSSDDLYYLQENLNTYVEDCVLFELKLPNARISRKELFEATDFISVFDNATNNAKFVVHYSDTHPEGETLSCTQSWALSKATLSAINDLSPEAVKFWNEKCKDAGFSDNISGAVGSDPVTVCRDKSTALINEILGSSAAASKIFTQHMIGSIMLDNATNNSAFEDIAVSADRSTGLSGLGATVTQSRWSLWFKSHMRIAFLGMLPFLVLFMATPWYNKVLSFSIGMFVFFISWSVCQSVLFNAFANVARDMFADTAQVQLGMTAPIMFAQDSAKALSTFGAFESLAFTLAGTFSAIFVKAAGAGFSRYGQDHLRQTGSAGRATAGDSALGLGYGRSLGSKSNSMADAETYDRQLGTAAGQGEMIMNSQANFHRDRITVSNAREDYGNGTSDFGAAANAMADANRVKQWMGTAIAESVRMNATARGIDGQTAVSAIQDYSQNSKLGEASAYSQLMDKLGLDGYQTMDFIKSVHSGAGLGNAQGLMDSYNNAKAAGEFNGELSDYIRMQKELESSKGFIDKATTHDMADKYFGGNERSFLYNQATYNQATTAGQLAELNNSGTGIAGVEAIASTIGRAKAIDAMAKSDFVRNAGFETEYQTMSSQLYQGAAKHAMTLAGGEILHDGNLSGRTMGMLRNLATDPTGRNHLMSQGMSNFVAGTSDQAGKLAAFLNANGHHVQADDLLGANVSMGLWANEAGQLQTGFVASKGGSVIDYQNVKHSQMYMSGSEAQSVTGKADAPAGMYNIYGNPNGQGALLVEGKSGFRHQSSDISMVESANGAHSLKYVDPNTGETAYQTQKAGYSFTDEAVTQHNWGEKITGDSVRSAALDGDASTSVGRAIFRDGMTNAQKFQAMEAVKKAGAEALSAYERREGSITTGVNVKGDAGIKYGTKESLYGFAAGLATGISADAQARLGIGYGNNETTAHNLNLVTMGKIMTDAQWVGALAGGDDGFDNVAAARYVDEKLESLFSNRAEYMNGENLTQGHYGGSAPIQAAKDAADGIIGKMGDAKDMIAEKIMPGD